LSLRKARALEIQGPFARTENIGRWTLRKRQIVRGYTPNDPWTKAGAKQFLRVEPRKRYAKLRRTNARVKAGSRVETLLANR